LLKTVKGFCCLMQEIKNGIDRTHLKQVSHFEKVGLKFDRWLDVFDYELILTPESPKN